MMLGMVCLDRSTEISDEKRAYLRAALSRRRAEHLHEYVSDHAYFAKADTGALFKSSGFLRLQDRSVAGVQGEPLVGFEDAAADHKQVATDVAADKHEVIQKARGVFCGFSYSESTGTLKLFADKLAVRPLYVWHDKDIVLFATAIRMFEALPFLWWTRDILALLETTAGGHPLFNRTRYKECRLLQPAEIVRFSDNKSESSTYWRWDKIKQMDAARHEIGREAYRVFDEAIKIRARDDRGALAYLSGGMDSRASVAALRNSSLRVTAFNFSDNDSQDLVFAQAFAEQIGCRLYHQTRSDNLDAEFRVSLANRLSELIDSDVEIDATRPRAVWSGDGGSVGVGAVHLDQRCLDLMREPDSEEAIRHFRHINGLHFPVGLLNSRRRSETLDQLTRSFTDEIGRQQCSDPAQSLFLFLMENDQRRHLHDFFEDLDIHRLEYQLPFFDSDFLEFIFSVPLDYRLNHRFYTDWFERFPEEVRAVPWQTYPGHEPCPLPMPEDHSYQWDGSRLNLRDRMSIGLAGFRLAFGAVDLAPISRSRLFAVTFMHLSGLKDYAYAIKAAHIVGCRPYKY